jgi:hypothetical protein
MSFGLIRLMVHTQIPRYDFLHHMKILCCWNVRFRAVYIETLLGNIFIVSWNCLYPFTLSLLETKIKVFLDMT